MEQRNIKDIADILFIPYNYVLSLNRMGDFLSKFRKFSDNL